MLKVLDLFSGIGGFSIGLEATGQFKTVAFCEIEKFPRLVLNKHWPDITVYEDVKTLTAERLKADGISVDVICGGFPCQDISLAGKGAGLEGERSGLWFEFHRLIKEIKPQIVIAENVSALRSRGLDQVLRSLFEIGYDAEWHCIPASAIGAPHRRDRIWIVGYPNSSQWRVQENGNLERFILDQTERNQVSNQTVGSSRNDTPYVAHSGSERLQGHEWSGATGTQRISERHLAKCSWWKTEPAVGRVADGVPRRVDRLKSLGNAVVPQIPELIGRAIVDSINK